MFSTRRRRQAETVERLVAARTRPDSRYLVLGDMNDPPEAAPLAAIAASARLLEPVGPGARGRGRRLSALGGGLGRVREGVDQAESGRPAAYELFDQIWRSPNLADRQTGAFIDRRTKHGGDGSDHDPAWVTLPF